MAENDPVGSSAVNPQPLTDPSYFDIKKSIIASIWYDKLYDGLEVEASRLVVVNTLRGERPAYEFYCSYGEENYLLYLDAVSGEEISIVNTKNL